MKATIVPDFGYVSTKGKGRVSAHKHLRGKLKYFTYRDNRDEHLKPEDREERWQDHGLGKDYRTILNNCDKLSSKHVLAWSWVISPAPDLMALVPEDMRRDLVVDLTERIVESYYTARGAEVPEYAFVLHNRLTTAKDGGEPGLQHLHTHVILPGTVPSLEGRHAFYNNTEKGHDRLFREIAAQHFEAALDEIVGERWRDLRREPEVEPTTPDLDDLDAWFPRER
ncbi:MAG: hypothetical protein HS103_01465 [Anaerolineales bacterium]|nr:hypothetical protein [Anaerolineales bacterium]